MNEALIGSIGLAWHVHHDLLVEFCGDYRGRQEYIEKYKPLNERELRLRLFKWVKRPLPIRIQRLVEKVITGEVANPEEFRATVRLLDSAIKNSRALKKLHALECPNCPWDGYSIFPGEVLEFY